MDDDPKTPGKASKKKAGRRGPRKVTEKRLENVALHYLGRYSASAESLRRVLMRRVRRSAEAHGTDAEEAAQWVEALIGKFRGLGYLDDRAYAETRARALRARGVSGRGVRARLREKGVGADDIDAALAALAADVADPELAAALALARRRRLGPYRAGPARAERREKDLAALARAGFSYEVARRVVEAVSLEELEAEAHGNAN
ncbi:MAG: RecX family transcriptional regulator [Magnetovibrio sp.]|nr:RecX family transcriptional regulator [Magnetovibrio sp.]